MDLERLVLVQPPEISEQVVRIELTWTGLDRAIRLLAGIAMGEVTAVLLAPVPGGRVVLHRGGGRTSGWNPEAVRPGQEALAIGITDEVASDAVAALSTIAVGAVNPHVAEIPGRFVRPAGEQDGLLVVVAPSGRRPSSAPPRSADGPLGSSQPVLHAHALEARGDRSLTATLLWPHVPCWVDRLAAAGAGGAGVLLVDETWRHGTLEWRPDVGWADVALRDGEMTCSLTMPDADVLGAFLERGLDRGAFPVDHIDFHNDTGASFTVVVPFDERTARAAQRSTPRSAARAACQPHIPCTPPPGGVDDEQMKSRGSGVA